MRVWTELDSLDLEYVTVTLEADTTVQGLVSSIVSRYRLTACCPSLFYLSLQLTDPNPAQQGLTR